MIKFKNNSLIYRMNKNVSGWALGVNACNCKTLCSYFWCTTYNLFLIALLGLVLMYFTSVYGVILMDIFGDYLTSSDLVISSFYTCFLVGSVGAVLTLVVLFITACLSVIMKEVFHTMKNKKRIYDSKKEPSLLFLWLKAKKDKVCPLIEFVDKENNNE